MEDNTGPRESKKKSMEDNTRSSESKEKRRKSMEDNTRPTESESEEDILDKGDEEAEEEHDQEPEVPTASSYILRRPSAVSRFTVCSAPVPRSSAPSFFRKARPRDSCEMINDRVWATITGQSVPGQNIVLVRPRTLGQTNPKEHNGLVPMEGDEEIFEEQAVCKFCFGILKEENILKTECKCGNALIHEECAANWSRMRGNTNCDSCGQEVQTFPVALVRWLGSSTQMVDKEESNKWSLFSWLTRIWKA